MIALSARGSGTSRIVGNLVVYSVLKLLSKPVGVRTVQNFFLTGSFGHVQQEIAVTRHKGLPSPHGISASDEQVGLSRFKKIGVALHAEIATVWPGAALLVDCHVVRNVALQGLQNSNAELRLRQAHLVVLPIFLTNLPEEHVIGNSDQLAIIGEVRNRRRVSDDRNALNCGTDSESLERSATLPGPVGQGTRIPGPTKGSACVELKISS